MKTAGIVLAAGHSKRFGETDKLLSNLNNQPLSKYSADTVSSVDLDLRIAVVSNPKVADIFDGFLIVQSNGQQSESLRVAVRLAIAHKMDRIVILLGDMPFVTDETINSLLLLSEYKHIVACSDGSKRSVPAVFSANYFQELLNISGDKGASKLIKQLPKTCLLDVNEQVLQDIDTKADLNSYYSN